MFRRPWCEMSLRSYTLMLAALAVLLAFIVLDRWAFTSFGLQSFGRVWQLYLSYVDVGFVRRALIGTFFSETDINRLFANEYVFAIAIHHVAILLLVGLIVRFIARHDVDDRLLIATILLSPVLIIQSGYATGALDVYVLIFAVLNIFYVRHLWLFSLILVLGIFTHELFVFTIPAQFVALIIRRDIQLNTIAPLMQLLLPAAVAIAALFIILCCGQTTIAQAEFEQMMLQKIPHAAHQHGLWSGYFEVGADMSDGMQSREKIMQELGSNLHYIAIPILYLLLVVARTVMTVQGCILKLLMLLASLAPLLTYLVANDFYRWVGMSANMALVLNLLLAAGRPKSAPVWLDYLILLFTLVAPFGSTTVERPFPMHQFVLEKLR